MNAKEKAQELINKFILSTCSFKDLAGLPKDDSETAQDCALIAISEIIRVGISVQNIIIVNFLFYLNISLQPSYIIFLIAIIPFT